MELKKKLRPEKEIYKVAKNFLKKLQLEGVKFELGGSVAKKTNLKGSSDIDIFARFKNDKNASKKLEELLKPYNPERIHGSRDYFQITHEGYCIEVVPVKLINNPEKANNVTDMSPLHVRWANERLNEQLRDDIRLAKQFCKAQKIYGAESHIRGISGHVLDILIIYYGGFINFLKQVSVWGDRIIIDIMNHGTQKSLDKSKTSGPLIVIDPIQKNRNAAAGMSHESLKKLKSAAKKYLETKEESMFEITKLNYSEFKLKNKNVTRITYKSLKGKDDVVGSKIRQLVDYIIKNTQEFKPLKTEWDFNQAMFSFKEKKLDKKHTITGPPLNKTQDVKRFKKAHKNTFEENGRLCAIEKREYLTAKEKIAYLVKTSYVQKRVKSIKI